MSTATCVRATGVTSAGACIEPVYNGSPQLVPESEPLVKERNGLFVTSTRSTRGLSTTLQFCGETMSDTECVTFVVPVAVTMAPEKFGVEPPP
jgi:hypothetical protein